MTPFEHEPAEGGVTRTRRRSKVLLDLMKAAVVVLVLFAVGGHIRRLIIEWLDQKRALRDLSINGSWLAAGTAVYIGGQICFGLYWGRLLKGLGASPSPLQVLRAYCVGTFGKYVPGKALVVVLRTGLIRLANVSRLPVGLSVVYETVTMMAVGSAVAGVCLLLTHPHPWVNWSGAAVAAVGLTAGLHPGVFGRLARFATIPFYSSTRPVAPSTWYATFWRWNFLSVGGWIFEGLSFWAVMRALGVACASTQDVVLLTGTVALASIIGFCVLFMPAGIGVRELVIIQLLASQYGASRIVLASLLLRIVWTLVEVTLSGALYGVPLLSSRWVKAAGARWKPDPSVVANAPTAAGAVRNEQLSADQAGEQSACAESSGLVEPRTRIAEKDPDRTDNPP